MIPHMEDKLINRAQHIQRIASTKALWEVMVTAYPLGLWNKQYVASSPHDLYKQSCLSISRC